MRITNGVVRTACALALAARAGCADDLPTLTGADRFPQGSLPTTIEVTLDAGRFLVGDTVFTDYANPRNAGILLVARDFDGVLDAHTLARFTGFPDSVGVPVDGTTRFDTAFVYGAGRVVATVNAVASTSRPTRLRLWELGQRWDSATVTWRVAADTGAAAGLWRVPGGTPAGLLAEATWTPGDTVAADSVFFQLDSLAMARIAARGSPGVLVTSETADSRLQITRLVVEASLRASVRPDTAVTRVVASGTQVFIHDPAAPRPASVYRIGGLEGARTVLALDLSQRVPACPAATPNPGCGTVSLRDVSLNRAELLLDPVPVSAGFRPLGSTPLRVRRVVETELGRRAPLGETFAQDSVPAAPFAAPGGAAKAIDLTSALSRVVSGDTTDVLARDSARATVALLAEPEGSRFGLLWFAPRPRLRLVYTLPLRPTLP